ncbi:DUF2092 domain-containing protein [Candidatus Skiveiella danica]|uniref:DUF2092 domain-containing protein n=1 Tax=Candidatus Skiveiella danica TaxID=3386177 RepID=UPI001D6EAA47|nr:DUF2092 domain-containing protein [Betaproteobacteria bacterium]
MSSRSYDGKTLTLFNPGAQTLRQGSSPATIDAMLSCQTKLDVVAPGSDLVDTRA